MWNKIRQILGALTDILLIGRKQGWWKRRGGIPPTPGMKKR